MLRVEYLLILLIMSNPLTTPILVAAADGLGLWLWLWRSL